MYLINDETQQLLARGNEIEEKASAEKILEIQANIDSDSDTDAIVSIDGTVGTVYVRGLLLEKVSVATILSGMNFTSYTDISDSCIQLQNDDNVESIVLDIDSGGGTFAGLFECMDMIATVDKPITSRVSGTTASAAYALATTASQILATKSTNIIGSIGVASKRLINANLVEFSSTLSPNKMPDLATEEGKEIARDLLNQMHDLFVARIAENRNTTPDVVNAEYGKGGVFLTQHALDAGMIDGFVVEKEEEQHTINMEFTMDLKTLKHEHSELFAEVLELGASAENKRVSDHLALASTMDAIPTALSFIADGSECGVVEFAVYAAVKKNEEAQIEASIESSEVDEAIAEIAAEEITAAKTDVELEEEAALAAIALI